MNKALLINIFFILSLFYCSFASAKNIDITQYGAKADGITINTKIIQKAIDSCAMTGGGKVIIPAGIFLSGTIYLKSHVNLHLEEGAILKGSNQFIDYQQLNKTPALIIAENLVQVAITGLGTIDGNGKDQNFQKGEGARGRPMLLFFVNCKDVTVKNIRLRNSAFWTEKYMGCDGVLVTGISVNAHANWNNDGIDMDSKNVIISDCRFDTNDDAICLKSERKEPCENVTITNCIAASNCNAIKFGTGSTGGFINININNCIVHKASEDNIWHWQQRLKNITESNTVISGIAIECVDGGNIDQVNISNITMKDVQTPIFIRLGDRNQHAGSLEHINISNIIATSESNMCSTISGIPGFLVKDLVIRNVYLVNHSAGKVNNRIDTIPENIKGYPENRMFGTELPAAGFYIRHAGNIKLENISLSTASGEERSFLVADDVRNIQIDNAGYDFTTRQVYPVIYFLNNVDMAVVTAPVFLPEYGALLRVQGEKTADINLFVKGKKKNASLLSLGKEIMYKNVVKVISLNP